MIRNHIRKISDFDLAGMTDPRSVYIAFDDRLNLFRIVSTDGKPVLEGYPYEQIRTNGWFAARDGHLGTNAIVIAPKEVKNKLELWFTGILE